MGRWNRTPKDQPGTEAQQPEPSAPAGAVPDAMAPPGAAPDAPPPPEPFPAVQVAAPVAPPTAAATAAPEPPRPVKAAEPQFFRVIWDEKRIGGETDLVEIFPRLVRHVYRRGVEVIVPKVVLNAADLCLVAQRSLVNGELVELAPIKVYGYRNLGPATAEEHHRFITASHAEWTRLNAKAR